MEFQDVVASPTLAKMYEEQGNYAMALIMYKKLSERKKDEFYEKKITYLEDIITSKTRKAHDEIGSFVMSDDEKDVFNISKDEKEKIESGTVYISPPNYHMLIEEDLTIALSTEEKKNYSRPSIDILFETAAYAYGSKLIGIVLTGANNDGADGLLKIKNAGGYCIVQEPSEAEAPAMPLAAIKKAKPSKVLKLTEIANLLIELDNK